MAAPRRFARALVTGASSGIGEAFARQLAAGGTSLVIVARSADKLGALAAELREAHEVDVDVFPADLGDPEQLGRVEARVAVTEQPIELVVNNAGYGYNGDFSDVPVDDEDAEIQVNVVALMRLCHAAVGRMRTSGWGGILNVSSVASFQPSAGSANYAATKAYVTSLTLALHEELADAGVHVSLLCPGLTRTEFQERGGYEVSMPDFVWQTPDEVAVAGLAGVATNKAMVVPGGVNTALHWGTRLLPGAVVRKVAGAVSDRTR